MLRTACVLTAGWVAGGCGRSPEVCYDDGVLDCIDNALAAPDGSAACRQQYLVGYADACICTDAGGRPPYLTPPTTVVIPD